MYFLSKLRTAAVVLKTKQIIKGTPLQTTVRNGGTWFYRHIPGPQSKTVNNIAEFTAFLMWYWMLYHLWHEPEHLTGHFPYPDPSKWTDEELGIPPDEEG